ncbi:phospholipid-transporting ATPase ID isoform X1 [Anopheles funestus]|uniref:phospholipid-transporting ATPase ID isoform X1 n=1 Tax=Anopheles funestus TaxID=62324 RepID=UPI0020C733D8|nr:phospholipid-transporting ATPase ID isoform X1 [Anopheles funestus]XP_049277777.1 phospholipid-transporting ATPase ID isoform X1 [Anopheles funestus]XP_049277778.1 phospholipid-transporting ATPase ID isoform X1 [Anopheles funestus]XP_049277779.1 phospholipid-transporting ATPase ID isoform X1 [Anopheles funestus]
MPISHATTDSVELEILEIRQDSSEDDEHDPAGRSYGARNARGRRIPPATVVRRQQHQQQQHEIVLAGSSSARGPETFGEDRGMMARTGSPPKRKRFRRNHRSSSTRRKSNSQSCGSLYNLAANRPLHPQRSEPNVNFYSSPENERRIRANDREYNTQFKYANNYIKTSKYSILTFLPLNLLEQFQRLANFYFLCLLILQLIPAISSLTPVTTAIPLIGVLMLTAIKDAYDDFQRHMSDSQVNNRRSKTLRHGKLVDERWSGVQVGDIIRMDNDQFVAADILLLSSSEPNGLCFIETAELDGETNLKCKQCLPETAAMGQQEDLLWKFNGEIVCEPPNNLLNKFEGTLTWKNQRYPLDNDKILLRGCIIRNTQWCYGVVIFAGKDTKLMQNSGKTKFKRTTIDRLLNFIIIGIVFFLLSICGFCTIASAIWEALVGYKFQIYLPWERIIPKDYLQGAISIGGLVFFSYAIVLNTVVPISLYVSVEVIRFAQSFLINWDEKMYYEKTKTHAKARTTTLNEELGQIQYIFSDKTGTLTQNIMTFNKCSIAGRAYGDVVDMRTGETVELSEPTFNSNTSLLLNAEEPPGRSTPQPTTTTEQPVQTKSPSNKKHPPSLHVTFSQHSNAQEMQTSISTKQPTPQTHIPAQSATEVPPSGNNTQEGLHVMESVDFSFNPEYEPEFRWYDQGLLDAVRADEEHAHNFFRLLALCHTVMAEDKNGKLDYQAQSPDEAALVSAARNFGFVFKSRAPNSITIEVMGRTEEYELLSILDFNNVRKRMSVVLRRNNSIILYCKGADSVIYDRLGPNQHDLKARTQEHLNKFAGEGLRTLVLAERRLTKEFYDSWLVRQREAALSLDGREDKLGAIYEEIECDMQLVGVTAIEDKLQDGVPQTIANLQLAGIKIWVLTGDKQETAINIGYSCQLLTDDMVDVFVIDGITKGEVEQQLRKYMDSLRIVNTYHPANVQKASNMHSQTVGSSETSAVTANGAHSSSSGPMVDIQNTSPPSVSVVTFRWDNRHKYTSIGGSEEAPDSVNCSNYSEGFEKGEPTLTDIDENTGVALVINGHSLVHCLTSELESKFLEIASHCKAVICCRVTPLQKAMVVELIKRAKNAVTLAIGDGANDVSMIKAAHIGVGISGQEGMQAVLASDYSIAQFKFLERLLLVHGRWSYYRMCKFLRYFFYKNFAFTLCHFWYAFFCGFSAQTVFDPMFISVYNLFYTSLPVLALGIFEQDVSDKSSVDYPKLYTPGITNALFNTTEFIRSVLHGIFSSLILFLIPYGTYKDGISPDGYVLNDHMLLGSVVATILILDNTAQIALDTSYWTVFNHIMIWGSLLWYFFLDYFYNYVIGGPYVGSLTQAMKEATFWFTTVLTVIVLMIPVLASRFYFVDVFPSLPDKIRVQQRLALLRSRQSSDVLRTPSARKARRSLRSGYAFAHQEGFGRLITSGKIMRKLPQDFAFPLGLGSKKQQSTESTKNNNNNNSSNNANSVTNAANGAGSVTRTGTNTTATTLSAMATGAAAANGNQLVNLPGSSNGDHSPRAPCQDLDTINL